MPTHPSQNETPSYDPVTGQTWDHNPYVATESYNHCPVSPHVDEPDVYESYGYCSGSPRTVPACLEEAVYDYCTGPPQSVPACPETTATVAEYCHLCSEPSHPLVHTRPAIPINTWQDVLVNFRRGNAGALMAMLKNAGPIMRRSIIPMLKILMEGHRNKAGIVRQPVTYWI
jgi:hypothetical protein